MNENKNPAVRTVAFTRHAVGCVADAKDLLLADLSHHYTIPQLARKVGLNSRTLQDCFKAIYGKSVFVFGQEARLDHSRSLLRETDLPIQMISEQCGYPEQSNFGTAFKKKFGIGPGEWRKGGCKYPKFNCFPCRCGRGLNIVGFPFLFF
jgi:AraC-like DNA-binding protein